MLHSILLCVCVFVWRGCCFAADKFIQMKRCGTFCQHTAVAHADKTTSVLCCAGEARDGWQKKVSLLLRNRYVLYHTNGSCNHGRLSGAEIFVPEMKMKAGTVIVYSNKQRAYFHILFFGCYRQFSWVFYLDLLYQYNFVFLYWSESKCTYIWVWCVISRQSQHLNKWSGSMWCRAVEFIFFFHWSIWQLFQYLTNC